MDASEEEVVAELMPVEAIASSTAGVSSVEEFISSTPISISSSSPSCLANKDSSLLSTAGEGEAAVRVGRTMERKTEDMRKVVTGNKFVDLATLIFDDARCVWCGAEFENGGASAGKEGEWVG